MAITQEIFEAFLKCHTKAHLIGHGVAVDQSVIDPLLKEPDDTYRHRGSDELRTAVAEGQLYIGTLSVQAIKRRLYALITNCSLSTPNLKAELHGLRLVRGTGRADGNDYIPFRFLYNEKISNTDRLLLAFDAFVFSQAVGIEPSHGEFIHGRERRTAKVLLTPLYSKVRAALSAIAAQEAQSEPPPVVLNKHCPECQYALHCGAIAKNADDLSLLSKMSEKEREKHHRKGIFTVTQLSHTFRHRKRNGEARHDHALKALAIRKNQVHVLGKVAWSYSGTPVYIDVEGDADRDFYYCIGLRFEVAGSIVQRSYWADDPSDEERMWVECLVALNAIDQPRLIHYGSYETSFLRQMKKRYPNPGPEIALDGLLESTVNLLAVVYAQVYFPTYSNGLKDIARHLGFRWSHPAASGLAALSWRRQWEMSREPELKERLFIYNQEDCAAAQSVAEALSALSRSLPVGGTDFVDATALKREYPKRFGKIDFALPEFQQINDAAQWDYQRERVYLRSKKRLRRRQETFPTKALGRIDRHVQVEEERPASCAQCGGTEIKRWGWLKRVTHDLRISRTGIRRWVVRHSFPRYVCWKCKATFHKFSLPRRKYGAALCAYVLYQTIEMQLSQRAVGKSLQQLFSIPASGNLINRLKAGAALRYEDTYEALLKKIVSGTLVHADETRTNLILKHGYVWVFTNHEEVAFAFSESREASTPQDVLQEFRGVLVSDFYTGYDSITCSQQKCLVHLMRDINEDLCKQPFNEEIRDISRKFATLLRQIVESVDRFGLKTRHLRKHRPAVDRFFGEILGRVYQTEVATGYQKRFAKNRDRLFTFLDHDGVPWNNNNAEHAIKAFARLRNIFGGTSTVKGMREYLILLSISETCRNKGVRFLDFLLSEESDVDQFAARMRRSRRQS
jgi:predicted RecB family nuclease